MQTDETSPATQLRTTAPITRFLPIVFNDVWPGNRSQWRFGFAHHLGRGDLGDYQTSFLRAGWYYDLSVQLTPYRPAGLQYFQTVRVGQPPTCATLAPYVLANPGGWWIIGNEPDRPLYQDSRTPSDYAKIYYSLYDCIKSRDASARVLPGGIVQPTPLRLQYLDLVLQSYQTRYGTLLPADGWNIHNMILRERRCSVYPDDCWGAEIPPGVSANQGQLYEIDDNDNIEYFKQQIVAFRQWMKSKGYQNLPLVISEYGINMPAQYGFSETRVIAYMYSTFQYMLTTKDCSLGQPTDGCRLVQRWSWYSLNDKMYDPTCTGNDCGFNGNLFDPDTHQMTAFGIAYRDRPYY